MTLAEELQRDADDAKDGGGMYYSGQYLQGYADRAHYLEAYDAMLRELIRIMYYCNLPQKDCDKCAMNGADMKVQISDIEFCDGLNELMRELGIEVHE